MICSWHAFISVIDNLALYASFSGYVLSTLDEYNKSLNQTVNSNITTYFDASKNQTMVIKSVLSVAERYDRYALVFFAVIYVTFHIIFVLWMYFSVNEFLSWYTNFLQIALLNSYFIKVYKRRREMLHKDLKYLV